jgi:hypothetical protein
MDGPPEDENNIRCHVLLIKKKSTWHISQLGRKFRRLEKKDWLDVVVRNCKEHESIFQRFWILFFFSRWRIELKRQILFIYLFIIVLLFICAYQAWVICPSFPHPLPYHPLHPLSLLPPHLYKAETILPLSLILLKREYKQ